MRNPDSSEVPHGFKRILNILYWDKVNNGESAGLTAREIVERIYGEAFANRTLTVRVSSRLRWMRINGWVKREPITRCKFRYTLSPSGMKLAEVIGVTGY